MKNRIIILAVVTLLVMLFLGLSDGEFATEARTFLRALLRTLF